MEPEDDAQQDDDGISYYVPRRVRAWLDWTMKFLSPLNSRRAFPVMSKFLFIFICLDVNTQSVNNIEIKLVQIAFLLLYWQLCRLLGDLWKGFHFHERNRFVYIPDRSIHRLIDGRKWRWPNLNEFPIPHPDEILDCLINCCGIWKKKVSFLIYCIPSS